MDLSVSKERISLLTAALRSGEYKQVQQRLRSDEGFCCLGVACDVYHKETNLGQWKETNLGQWSAGNNYYFKGTVDVDSSSVIMPRSVADWFGFPSNAGQHKVTTDDARLVGSEIISLFELNDSAGWTFEQIADYIDANVETLTLAIRPETDAVEQQ